MLSPARRALLIGLVGPTIQALGLLWLVAHLLLVHLHDPINPRHLVFEGGFLAMGAGLLVTLLCVPVAIEVARASEEEVRLHHFEPEESDTLDSQSPIRRRVGASQ